MTTCGQNEETYRHCIILRKCKQTVKVTPKEFIVHFALIRLKNTLTVENVSQRPR